MNVQGWEWKIIPSLKRILPTRRALSGAAGTAGDLPRKIFLNLHVLRWFSAHSEAKFHYLGSIKMWSKMVLI